MRRSSGFTLLELMVVLVLVGIIFSFAMLSLVITSYSIHYTKLYDQFLLEPCLGLPGGGKRQQQCYGNQQWLDGQGGRRVPVIGYSYNFV